MQESLSVTTFRSFLHDLANPLTVINLNLEYLAEKLNGQEDLCKLLIRSMKGMDEVSKLIENSRIEILENPSDQEFSAVSEICKIVEMFGYQFECKSIELIMDLRVNKIFVGNPAEFRRIIRNLLENAIFAVEGNKFFSRREISICSKILGGKFIITISDNGKGLTCKEKKRIFDLGYTTRTTGQGLGLFIVLQMLAKFRGKIFCSSHFGKGTAFELQFDAD